MNKDIQKKINLIWRFLKGSKRFFAISIIFTAVACFFIRKVYGSGKPMNLLAGCHERIYFT